MAWCNPPPPGTVDEELVLPKQEQEAGSTSGASADEEVRPIDRIDPFLKSSEYLRYERKLSSERSGGGGGGGGSSRRRSRSPKHKRRRRSSRSGSRSRRTSRHRHRRRRSSSRSRSRSHSRHRRRRRSRSRSRSRRRHRERRDEHPPPPSSASKSSAPDAAAEEEDEDDAHNNAFKNDGSFMEMFKRMQEAKAKAEAELQLKAAAEEAQQQSRPALPAFGKRRGGKVLKTGLVQKTKLPGQEQDGGDGTDAWSMYMKEVKRYKEACCDDDSKTRLLVK